MSHKFKVIVGVVAGIAIVAAVVVSQSGLSTGSLKKISNKQAGRTVLPPNAADLPQPFNTTDTVVPDRNPVVQPAPLPSNTVFAPMSPPFNGPLDKCTPPYHVMQNGQCYWSCGEGTNPDTTGLTNSCLWCKVGMHIVPSTSDWLGRRICR